MIKLSRGASNGPFDQQLDLPFGVALAAAQPAVEAAYRLVLGKPGRPQHRRGQQLDVTADALDLKQIAGAKIANMGFPKTFHRALYVACLFLVHLGVATVNEMLGALPFSQPQRRHFFARFASVGAGYWRAVSAATRSSAVEQCSCQAA